MSYKPTLEDLVFAKKVFDEIIWTQTLNPTVVREAFRKVFGYDAVTYQQAKIKLFAYFQHEFKGFDKTDIVLPDSTAASTTGEYTHTEDVDEKLMAEQFINDVKESGIVEKETLILDETKAKPKRKYNRKTK